MNQGRSRMHRLGGGIVLALLAWSCSRALAQTPAPQVDWPRPALSANKGEHQRLLDIASVDDALVAVGEHGLILRSQDGEHWDQIPSPVDAMLTRVRFFGSRRGWALGHDGTLLETTDAGFHWSLRHFDPDARALLDLILLDDGRWLAIGAYGLMLESLDDGQSWQAQDNVLTDLSMHLNSVVRDDAGTLFVAGERGLAARSSDGGQHWQVLDFPYAGSLFGARVFDGSLWVYGMRGRLYRTEDLARCAVTPAETWDSYERITRDDPQAVEALGWVEVKTPSEESLLGALAERDRLWLFGVNGTLLEVRNGQVVALDSPADQTLSAGARLAGHLHVVGRRGALRIGQEGR